MLEAYQLNKHFGGVMAVSGISFHVSVGEILACVGPNGAGKTTVINLISGWQTPDKGYVKINGERVTRFCPEEFAARGVVRTFQKARLFQKHSVLENLLLASRPQSEETLRAAFFFRKWWRRKQRQELVRAEKILNELGISHLGNRSAEMLSGGEQRLVELATAAMRQPKILVLDEPVANLSQDARQKIVTFLLKQRQSGIACILVEHDLSFIQQVADRILVLAQGAVLRISDASALKTFETPQPFYLSSTAGDSKVLLQGVSGSSPSESPKGTGISSSSPIQNSPQVKAPGCPSGVSLIMTVDARLRRILLSKRIFRARQDSSITTSYKELTIRNLLVDYGQGPVIQDVNIDISPGEIVALVGGNGAGKSTTVRSILGLIPYKGSINLGQTLLTSLQPHDISRLGVAYVPQHRKVFPSLTVLENLLLANQFRQRLDGRDLEHAFQAFPELKGYLYVSAGNLSGGQQQMVAIARAILAAPRLLLLDEPSAGLSDDLWKRCAEILIKLASQGLPIFYVEHRLSALNDATTRAYFMKDGRVVTQMPLRKVLDR